MMSSPTLFTPDVHRSYVGWLRDPPPPNHWRRVASGRDWSEAWDRLLAVRSEGRLIERIVLPAGVLPAQTRARR